VNRHSLVMLVVFAMMIAMMLAQSSTSILDFAP
jgi:hypothetical protein